MTEALSHSAIRCVTRDQSGRCAISTWATTAPAPRPDRSGITPNNAGWDIFSFAVIELQPGESHTARLDDQETAIVPLSGAGIVKADNKTSKETFELSRTSVFEQCPRDISCFWRTDPMVA